MSLLYFRWLLLALSGLALLTGVAMHGLVRRLMLPRIVDASQSQNGIPSHALRLFSVMIGRAWVFRIYHLCFAVLFLAAWWYFGTTAGNVAWTQLITHS
ncbi:MAG TPA: hypothetical protein VLI40_00505 [Gemmatimonadaceae bacterium]|nr:hypothetical protein [Gemmatimonadaceae bacterium]